MMMNNISVSGGLIPKITSANLCKPVHDIIYYSTSIYPLQSGKCRKEGKKLQKFDYPEKEKSFLDEKNQFFKDYYLVKK